LYEPPPAVALETLLRHQASECAELRELLYAVAGALERLACERPELSSRFPGSAARSDSESLVSSKPAQPSAPPRDWSSHGVIGRG
jgi:hypothetical protein